ncbi:unnamed protein product [Caenorhabditis nigoni]
MDKEYLKNGKLEVEAHVEIQKMLGFPRKELRSFGEEMDLFSDMVLKVKERKFYVSKLYLSSHSPYFATLFLENFQESEIELNTVEPQDFQYYLEILYLETEIDVDNVDGFLPLADKFDTPTIVKKCEKFLMEKSKLELEEKLELAEKYRMEELKKQCMDQIEEKMLSCAHCQRKWQNVWTSSRS